MGANHTIVDRQQPSAGADGVVANSRLSSPPASWRNAVTVRGKVPNIVVMRHDPGSRTLHYGPPHVVLLRCRAKNIGQHGKSHQPGDSFVFWLGEVVARNRMSGG